MLFNKTESCILGISCKCKSIKNGLKISGSKVDFTIRVHSHSRGNTIRDVLEDEARIK